MISTLWRPSIGVWPSETGFDARVWAPDVDTIEIIFESVSTARRVVPLQKSPDGYFAASLQDVTAGDRYRFRVNGQQLFPDPASRFQPEGVHGPSEVVDPSGFAWSDQGWRGIPRDRLVLYELHVGTFTPDGTFEGVRSHLSDLADLGINAIELMPVADFPGRRNWGYDGVDLFAPARCYGSCDDLRRLVNDAHRFGISVILDVVYNHLGPDGNYLGLFSPYYFSAVHRTPWGPAINLDGEQSEHVRAFFIENALHWFHEYHVDGLRLDATHSLVDEGPRHFLAELASAVRESVSDRVVHLFAEDWRNLSVMLKADREGGWGLDAVWVDDFHHQLRRYLVGDHEGVFRDFRGTIQDLVTTMNRGWLFCGEPSIHRGCARGTDPAGIDPTQLIYFIQNHDRIGNRALGERLNHQVDLPTYRAASVLLLCAAEIPMLFMGQEWDATSPFLFFTDHEPELGLRVTEGRRREFSHYAAFRDPDQLDRLPDIQAEETFMRCRLDWSERAGEPHAGVLRLYRALVELRANEISIAARRLDKYVVQPLDEEGVCLRRDGQDGAAIVVAVRLKGSGELPLPAEVASRTRSLGPCTVLLSTEDPRYATDPRQIDISEIDGVVHLDFERPGAVILKRTPRPVLDPDATC